VLVVTFFKDGRNRPSSFLAAGHADFADRGEDIVCAAVSAILQAARLGLEAHARIPLDVESAGGSMRVRWPASAAEDAAVGAIVATAELSVEQIARQYPDHVRFERATEDSP
jgi:uncharacterized protein YsxB (DUF464 family)